MTIDATVAWEEGLAFKADLDGVQFYIDNPSKGRAPKGPKPKGLTLVSLAGCSGMDVVSMLQKMHQKVEGFEIRVKADVAEEHPKKILAIHLIYLVSGTGLDPEAVKRAVELSRTKYCGVSATLAPAVPITHEIRANGQLL